MKYSNTFKSKMVRRMVGPDGLSATAVSDDIGIPQPTLSRWLREAASGKVSAMPKTKTKKERRPQDWTPGEKIAAVAEAGGSELWWVCRRAPWSDSAIGYGPRIATSSVD